MLGTSLWLGISSWLGKLLLPHGCQWRTLMVVPPPPTPHPSIPHPLIPPSKQAVHNIRNTLFIGNMEGERVLDGRCYRPMLKYIKEHQPKCIFMENVKGISSKKHKQTLKKILNALRRIRKTQNGTLTYSVYHKEINTSDHSIPQNRARLYIVAVHTELENVYGKFEWPASTPPRGDVLTRN